MTTVATERKNFVSDVKAAGNSAVPVSSAMGGAKPPNPQNTPPGKVWRESHRKTLFGISEGDTG